jgi:hypothetical protein
MSPLPKNLEQVGLASETFTLTLNRQVRPGPISSLTCKFSYIWDFPRNMGHATLVSVDDGSDINLWMFPLGINNQLDFMNSDHNTVILPSGKTIVLYRVILDLVPGRERAAAIMIGETGDEILATQSWDENGEGHTAVVQDGR